MGIVGETRERRQEHTQESFWRLDAENMLEGEVDMEQARCFCHNGSCHRCSQRAIQLARCPGCQHWYCPACIRQLGQVKACDRCAVIWLEVTTRLAMPVPVAQWIDAVTLPQESGEVW